MVRLVLECLASTLAFFRAFTLGDVVCDCVFDFVACAAMQSEGLERRHSSLVYVLVSVALWPAQHSSALDFHERASVCLSAGFAVLRLGHIEQACPCVHAYVSALGQICARSSRAHACFLPRVHVWYGCRA